MRMSKEWRQTAIRREVVHAQVVDLDSVNPKKLGVLGGAFVFADVLSGLITGRLEPILAHRVHPSRLSI